MKFDIYFLGFRKEILFGGITDNTIAVKNVKKNVICLKVFWYKVFVDWKLIQLNFLLDSISVLNATFSRSILNRYFMFSYSNHLMILTIALQSIHICLIKLDFLRAFDPTISHNLNCYQGPLFWSSLCKHLTTVCIVTSLSNLKFTVKSVEYELLFKYSS